MKQLKCFNKLYLRCITVVHLEGDGQVFWGKNARFEVIQGSLCSFVVLLFFFSSLFLSSRLNNLFLFFLTVVVSLT